MVNDLGIVPLACIRLFMAEIAHKVVIVSHPYASPLLEANNPFHTNDKKLLAQKEELSV